MNLEIVGSIVVIAAGYLGISWIKNTEVRALTAEAHLRKFVEAVQAVRARVVAEGGDTRRADFVTANGLHAEYQIQRNEEGLFDHTIKLWFKPNKRLNYGSAILLFLAAGMALGVNTNGRVFVIYKNEIDGKWEATFTLNQQMQNQFDESTVESPAHGTIARSITEAMVMRWRPLVTEDCESVC